MITKSLEIKQRSYGADSHFVADDLCLLGILSQNKGKFNDAESIYAKALEIYEKTIGSEDSCVIEPLIQLSTINSTCGKLL